jgi:hypothetical protein
MAEDKKISELTENPSINGSEEIATERGGSNYKNTYEDLKTWIGVGDNNIEGGNSSSIYLTNQVINGGNSNI